MRPPGVRQWADREGESSWPLGPFTYCQMANRCIIFLHIPKTGGKTLKRALRWKHDSEFLQLEDYAPPEAVEEVPLEGRRRARVATGHVAYGVHNYLPQRSDYITLVREPVARVVSYYYYILGHPKHFRHHELVSSGIGLEEFVERSQDRGVENEQTAMLAGRSTGEEVPQGLDRDALEKAKSNLERFLVVGLTERFDESFILIRRAFGWKLPAYVTGNVNPQPKPASERALALIRERNRLDLELYAFARDRFDAAVEAHGRSLQRELAVFRTVNRLPNRIRPYTPEPLRRLLRRLPS